jgi:saccharopine dehydrogenase-like protein
VSKRIIIFGATGFTGRQVAERLAVQGAAPVLAGRSEGPLREQAERLGVEWRQADALRRNSVFALLERGDVLVSTVGPFAKWGEPAVRAAIAARGTYIDSTGEPAFIRRVFSEFGPPADRAGATLLTAMGYDYVPGALAAALALEEAAGEAGGEGEARSQAVRADVGYYAFGAGTSGGTRASSVGILVNQSHAFRNGALRLVRTGERVRSFTVRGKERPGLSLGGAEHLGLPASFPQLREINVYLGWFGALARPVQAASLAGSVAMRVPGARWAMETAGDRLASMAGGPEPGAGISHVVGQAFDASGAQLSEVQLSGPEPYALTADIIAWAAQQEVHGTGALGPVQAFGLRALEEGCRQAGLERVSD